MYNLPSVVTTVTDITVTDTIATIDATSTLTVTPATFPVIITACILLLFVVYTPYTHADELFIPRDMVISGDYQGVFIRDDARHEQIVTLLSDSDTIRIPDSLYFRSDQNHAVFDIELNGPGKSLIVARNDQTFYNATVSVHPDKQKDYNILLILPEKTSTTENVTGMVFLTDDFLNPVYPQHDTNIHFATDNISVEQQVTVPAGSSFAFFSAQVRGDSWITAYTEKSASERMQIDYGASKKEVRLGIAADVAAPYSFAYLFAWLVENDKPIAPLIPIQSTLHVSDADIVGISEIYNDSETVYMRDGFAMRTLITNHPGESSVTITVPGYGTATKTIVVDELFSRERYILDQAILDGCDVDLIGTIHNNNSTDYTGCDSGDYRPTSKEQYVNTVSTTDLVVRDTVTANVFPPVTSGDAYLVWSVYKEVDPNISSSFTSTYNRDRLATNSVGVLDTVSDSYRSPAYGLEGTNFFVSSQSLAHDQTVSFEPGLLRTQSNMVPLSGSIIGNHTISVSSPTMLGVATSEFEISPPVKYSMSITSLPPTVLLQQQQHRPLYAVSVLDSEGYTVDPHRTFGDLSVTLLSDDAEFVQNTVFLTDSVTVIHGTSAVSYPSVTIIATDEDIVVSNTHMPKSGLSVDIQIPKKVHAGEVFPAYAFLSDSEQRPLSDMRRYLQTNCDTHDGLFSCVDDAEFTIFENSVGFATGTVSVFENEFAVEDIFFEHVGAGDTVGIGSEVLIPFRIPDGAILDVITSMPFTILGIGDDVGNTSDSEYRTDSIGGINGTNVEPTVILRPNTTGEYNIGLSVSKPGFQTFRVDALYTVNDRVILNVKTVTQNGVSVISSVSVSQDGDTFSTSTPNTIDISRGDVHLEFEPTLIIDSAGYSFDGATISEIPYGSSVIDAYISLPTDITATYRRVINIVVTNADGGGVYDYGQQVTLHAPSRDVVSFLIRDVFERWDYGDDDGNRGNIPDTFSHTVTVTAEQSFSVAAVYRQDISGLILVVIVAVSAMFVFTKRDRLSSIVHTYTGRSSS